jgi:hypothetical protein
VLTLPKIDNTKYCVEEAAPRIRVDEIVVLYDNPKPVHQSRHSAHCYLLDAAIADRMPMKQPSEHGRWYSLLIGQAY